MMTFCATLALADDPVQPGRRLLEDTSMTAQTEAYEAWYYSFYPNGIGYHGGVGDDIQIGDGNNNKWDGEGGNDLFLGYGGNDADFGNVGNDISYGGTGNDHL